MGLSLDPVRIVEDAGSLARMCEEAQGSKLLALDTEADSFHSYHHKLCLIQLSFLGKSFVVDPLVLGRESMGPLLEVLANPAVVKLLHGADYDLRTLDRDLGARLVNLRDTQIAAQLLGEKQTGLASLVAKELGHELDKSNQRADWGLRPLTPELIEYAVADTMFLEELTGLLSARLEQLGRLAWWEEECCALELVHWQASPADEMAFLKVKGAAALKGGQRDRLAALHAWRETEAARADIPAFRVLRGEALVAMAVSPPSDLRELGKVGGVGPATVRKYGKVILEVLTDPPGAPSRPPRERPPFDRERENRIREARAVRDTAAAALAVDPGVLAPRAALELVVDRRPKDDGELLACVGRRWRVGVLASELLPLVARWNGSGAGADACPE